MIPDEFNPEKLKAAIERGGVGDLRFACNFADRIVTAVIKAKHEETLNDGFQAFRARNDYIEDTESNPGYVNFYALSGKDICAPPKEKVSLGRFNARHEPVLYLSTTREVALAETRALSTGTCTVGAFRTIRPLRIAQLLQHNKESFALFLSEKPSDDDREKWLLARTAEFVSRRVPDQDRDLHYRVCNLIGSAFRESGFDGLAYRTSFWSNGWREDGRSPDEDHIFASNIVLFDPEAAIPKSAALYQIEWKRPIAQGENSGAWVAKS